jgi:hypothetical protein
VSIMEVWGGREISGGIIDPTLRLSMSICCRHFEIFCPESRV